jgi:hypothetical protein
MFIFNFCDILIEKGGNAMESMPWGTIIYQIVIFAMLIAIPIAFVWLILFVKNYKGRVHKLEQRIAVLEEKKKQ